MSQTGWVPDAPAATGWVPDIPASQHPEASMSAHPSGSWLNDLESDIRYGSNNTFIGKILKGMGAEGVNEGSQSEAGNFMASPALGGIRAARGATELPEHPWQGTKDIAGGALEASQIPAALAVGPEEEAASRVASVASDAFAA